MLQENILSALKGRLDNAGLDMLFKKTSRAKTRGERHTSITH